MRNLFNVLVTAFIGAATFGQGTVIFNNRTQQGDAPIGAWMGGPFGSLPDAKAQLYLQTAPGVFKPLTPATTFRTSSPEAMWFVTEINPFMVEGVLPGQSATFKLVAYQGESYEAAIAQNLQRGESATFTIAQLGGTPDGGAPIPTPSLNGLQGFALIPEPSTLVLGALGSGLLLALRPRT
jgi:hypothetical protein